MSRRYARGAPQSEKIAKVARPPEVHVCAACGEPAFSACGIGDVWFHPSAPCLPPGFMPHDRGAA